MAVCRECQPIEAQMNTKRHEVDTILNSPGYIQGPGDPQPGKPDPEMLGEVRELWKEVASLEAQLVNCIIAKCSGKPDLFATLAGSAQITINGTPLSLGASVTTAVQIGLLFHKTDHTTVTVTGLTISGLPFTYTIGPWTITFHVTMSLAPGVNTGTFDPNSGALALDLTLNVAIDSSFIGSYELNLPLSTSQTGDALTSSGAVKLRGSSNLVSTATGPVKGPLNGAVVDAVITGTISPQP
jgi:hypothetical protein